MALGPVHRGGLISMTPESLRASERNLLAGPGPSQAAWGCGPSANTWPPSGLEDVSQGPAQSPASPGPQL